MKTTKLLFAILTITMAVAGQAQAQSFLTNGLVAYYPLNGNANDVSGNGINGTVVSAVPATDRFGARDSCYSFNGSSAYIYAPADMLPTGYRTVSLWFDAYEVTNAPVFLGYGVGCGSSFWMGLNLDGRGSFTVGTHCGGYELDVPYTIPPTNAWHQWVVVMNDEETIFYLDGNVIGTEMGTPTTDVAGTQLGLGVTSSASTGAVPYSDPNLGYLDGYLDDVRIYNVALSASDAAELYALESSTPDWPSITQQPQSQIVDDGANATFTVGVNGIPTLSYQWLSNNTAIAGATMDSYTITNFQPADAASYSVVVTNDGGAVTSTAATLTEQSVHTAIATASVVNGFVVGVTITDGGYGYTNTPDVRIIGGGGSGAEAVAVVSNGLVIAIHILDAGGGYTNAPVVVIDPPFIFNPVLGIAPMSFLAFSNLTVSGVYQLQELAEGYYWTNQPFSFTATNSGYTQIVPGVVNNGEYRLALSPVPAQAFAVADVVNGFVVGATLTSDGSGYLTNPPVSIVSDDGGTNATAVSQISRAGVVTNIMITSAGIDYTNAPLIEIGPPPAAAVSPTVLPMVQLNSASLAPYDNYQIQFTPALGVPWGNWNGGLFTPTDVTNTQLFFFTNGTGFFRLRYAP